MKPRNSILFHFTPPLIITLYKNVQIYLNYLEKWIFAGTLICIQYGMSKTTTNIQILLTTLSSTQPVQGS